MHELPPKGSSLTVFHPDLLVGSSAAAFLFDRGYRATMALELPLTEIGPARVRLWQPSPFLVESWHQIQADLPAHARVLDLGCGSGREAVWLALQGCQVDAIDVLPDALEKAASLAHNCGVTIHTICRDLVRNPLAPSSDYDVVCLFRFVHRPLITAIPSFLCPEGFAIIEAFHARDAAHGKQGRHTDRLLADGELSCLLGGMEPRILHDPGEHSGRWFTQLLARRPANRL